VNVENLAKTEAELVFLREQLQITSKTIHESVSRNCELQALNDDTMRNQVELTSKLTVLESDYEKTNNM